MNFSTILKKQNFLLSLFLIVSSTLQAQETYEVQVYSSPTMAKNTTIFELHSNISPTGPRNQTDFTHPVHETLEITTGITPNFELGFYLFNRINNGTFNYSGSHIRPRITVPASWKWFMGTSLSVEGGYVKDVATNNYDADYEIRPIFDKTVGKNYLSINPTIDGSFKTKEVSFSPNIKYSYLVNPKYSLGIEYYGSTGNPFRWDNYELQTHQFYLVTDLYLDIKHEIEFGVGRGTTMSSDVWNIKLILGQRVNWIKNKTKK
jgi:hypothetical protein